jgi:elongation factor Ts
MLHRLAAAGVRRLSAGGAVASEVSVPAALIKTLRERTGAPISDCKKALQQSQLNTDAAVEWLRKSGMNVMNKLHARNAIQGLVGAVTSPDFKTASIVELKCETDFVARNEMFQETLSNISEAVLSSAKGKVTKDSVAELPLGEKTISAVMTDVVLAMRENIEIGRIHRIAIEQGVIGCYVHNRLRPGVGDNAAVVVLESETSQTEDLENFAKRLAMHVVAAKPRYLSRDDVPQEKLDKEKAILLEAMKDLASKPPAVQDKILTGKLGKFFEEQCLLEQVYILDDVDGSGESKSKRTISKIVAEKGKELGSEVKLTSFVRFKVGETDE